MNGHNEVLGRFYVEYVALVCNVIPRYVMVLLNLDGDRRVHCLLGPKKEHFRLSLVYLDLPIGSEGEDSLYGPLWAASRYLPLASTAVSSANWNVLIFLSLCVGMSATKILSRMGDRGDP